LRRLMLVCTVALAASCGSSGSLPDKPQIQPDKLALNFGADFGYAVYVGTQPQDTVKLQNGGKQQLVITSVTVAGTDAALYTAVADKLTADSEQSVFISVVYTPKDPTPKGGANSAVLTIVSNAENKPSLDIPLGGAAVLPAPSINSDRSEILFDTVNLGGTSSVEVQLSNGNAKTLTITGIEIVAPNPNVVDNRLLFNPTMADGTDIPATIALDRKQSTTIKVTYKPTKKTGDVKDEATLRIHSNAGNNPQLDIGMGGLACDPATQTLCAQVCCDNATETCTNSACAKK